MRFSRCRSLRPFRIWTFLFLMSGALLLTASACQHEAPNAGNAPIMTKTSVFPKLPTTPQGFLLLTQSGENSQARFSPDGTQIIFISRARPNHKHAQVYEMTFTQKVDPKSNKPSSPVLNERRLTFHDGDDSDPMVAPDGAHFYYASATDELKEESVATEKLMRTYFPEGLGPNAADGKALLTELYWQSFNGREIERLTNSAGMDSEVDAEPKTDKHIVFTSTRDGWPGIYIADAKARVARRLSDAKSIDHGARFSPDGKSLVWFRSIGGPNAQTKERTGANTESQIFVADGNFKSPRLLVGRNNGGAALAIEPTWHPNGTDIIFSMNRDDRYFNLYSINVQTQCLKRISKVEMDQTQPNVSPDGKRVLFTGHIDGTTQLYSLDYKADGPCLAAAAPNTISVPVPAPATAGGAESNGNTKAPTPVKAVAPTLVPSIAPATPATPSEEPTASPRP